MFASSNVNSDDILGVYINYHAYEGVAQVMKPQLLDP